MEEETRTEQSGLITEELRDWMGASTHNTIGTELIMGSYNKLLAIADRIDEQHERQCAESWMRGHDAWAAIDRSDEMAQRGLVKLPVDADGQVWTGKERVFVADNGSRYDMRYLMYDGNDWLIDSSNGGFPVGCCRHVQPDSWERIIEDAANYAIENIDKWRCKDVIALNEFIERCRRLAGEAE